MKLVGGGSGFNRTLPTLCSFIKICWDIMEKFDGIDVIK